MVKLFEINQTDQFYPTPAALITKMLDKLNFEYCESFLEPSAGKGDIAEQVLRKANRELRYNRASSFDIDCIEIDPYLRQILQYHFSDERLKEQRKRYSELNEMLYSDRTPEQNTEMSQLKAEMDELKNTENVHIVYDDFLTFQTSKRYDAIVMNPPFANGDYHLLHALELQKYGGEIVCLLNAETIRNPYSNTRKELKKLLERYEADIEYIPDAFRDAERKTDVEIALIQLSIPRPHQGSFIFERLKKAREQERSDMHEPEELIHADSIHAAIEQYDFEIKGTLTLVHEYEAMKPYMLRSLDDKSTDAILTLSLYGDRNDYKQIIDINRYLQIVRLKYWRALFNNPQFTGMMTTNILKEYQSMVERLRDYDFNEFNIRTLKTEMLSRITDGVQKTILDLFEKLTVEHAWYSETKQSIHYFNGWKTNKAHKIGKKSIIPTWGIFSTYSWNKGAFSTSTAYEVLSDIEKAFNYLDGGMTAEVNLLARIEAAAAKGQTRNIACKYFKVDFYKKGTTHIKFTNKQLVDRLNIYAAKHKAWLPPNYGHVAYDDMKPEEQAVVDSFQGRKAYEEVLRNADYYLSDVTEIALLEGA